MFKIQNSIIENFDKFVATVYKWIETKIFPQLDNSFKESDEVSNCKGKGKAKVVNVQDYAVNVIWEWAEIFCGFRAYSVQEVFSGQVYSTVLSILPMSFGLSLT